MCVLRVCVFVCVVCVFYMCGVCVFEVCVVCVMCVNVCGLFECVVFSFYVKCMVYALCLFVVFFCVLYI